MSPSPESHLLFESWLKIGKYQFWGSKFKKEKKSKKGMKVKAQNCTFIKKKIIIIFFLFFRGVWNFFLKKSEKKYMFIPTKSQPNFVKGLCFLAFFHTCWVPWQVWKNAKPFENCTWWSGTLWVWFFSSNSVFDQLMFSLNTAVVIHPKGHKCLRNE